MVKRLAAITAALAFPLFLAQGQAVQAQASKVECKGLEQAVCEKTEGCQWIKHKAKPGKKPSKDYCRKKPAKKGAPKPKPAAPAKPAPAKPAPAPQ